MTYQDEAEQLTASSIADYKRARARHEAKQAEHVPGNHGDDCPILFCAQCAREENDLPDDDEDYGTRTDRNGAYDGFQVTSDADPGL